MQPIASIQPDIATPKPVEFDNSRGAMSSDFDSHLNSSRQWQDQQQSAKRNEPTSRHTTDARRDELNNNPEPSRDNAHADQNDDRQTKAQRDTKPESKHNENDVDSTEKQSDKSVDASENKADEQNNETLSTDNTRAKKVKSQTDSGLNDLEQLKKTVTADEHKPTTDVDDILAVIENSKSKKVTIDKAESDKALSGLDAKKTSISQAVDKAIDIDSKAVSTKASTQQIELNVDNSTDKVGDKSSAKVTDNKPSADTTLAALKLKAQQDDKTDVDKALQEKVNVAELEDANVNGKDVKAIKTELHNGKSGVKSAKEALLTAKVETSDLKNDENKPVKSTLAAQTSMIDQPIDTSVIAEQKKTDTKANSSHADKKPLTDAQYTEQRVSAAELLKADETSQAVTTDLKDPKATTSTIADKLAETVVQKSKSNNKNSSNKTESHLAKELVQAENKAEPVLNTVAENRVQTEESLSDLRVGLNAQQEKPVNEHKSSQANVGQTVKADSLVQQDKVMQKQTQQQLKDAIPLNDKNAGAQAVNDAVKYMVNGRIQAAELRLDPPELGHMKVKISMTGDQASVSVLVQNPQAKELLDQAIPKLKEMLESAGIQLGDANIEQQNKQPEQHAGRGQKGRGGESADESDQDENVVAENQIKNGHLGEVDYYA